MFQYSARLTAAISGAATLAISFGGAASAAITIGAPTVSNGILNYQVQSTFERTTNSDGSQAYTDIRVVEPSAGINSSTRILYVLPVQAGTPNTNPAWNTSFGDGITTIQTLNLANLDNVVVVEPDFNSPDPAVSGDSSDPSPWYGNNPTNPAIQQQSYIVDDVVPAMDRLFSKSSGVNMLLGYSKSGWGAMSLMLADPTLFSAAAIWDAPLMMSTVVPAAYQDEDIVFGSNAYFQQYYELTNRLASLPESFQTSSRLWFGINPGSYFPTQMQDFETDLENAGIQFTSHTESQTLSHSWDPTDVNGTDYYWEINAVNFLIGASPIPEPATTICLPAALLAILGRRRAGGYY